MGTGDAVRKGGVGGWRSVALADLGFDGVRKYHTWDQKNKIIQIFG